MGNIYRLVDDGYPTFKKIMSGRKWIGRVCKTATGFLGIIGKTEYKGLTERETFNEVVAKHCGHRDSTAMAASSREVRAANSARLSRAKYVHDEMLRGNFKPLDEMLGLTKKGN